MLQLIKRFVQAAGLGLLFGFAAWWEINVALDPKAQHLVVSNDHPFFKKTGSERVPLSRYSLHWGNGLLQDATGRFIAFVDPFNKSTDSTSLLVLDFDQPGWELQTSVRCSDRIADTSFNSSFGYSVHLIHDDESKYVCEVTHPSLDRKLRLAYDRSEMFPQYASPNENCYVTTWQVSSPDIVFCVSKESCKSFLESWPWMYDLVDRCGLNKWIGNPSWTFRAEWVNCHSQEVLWSHNSSVNMPFRTVAGITLQVPAWLGPEYVLSQDKRAVLLKRETEQGLEFIRWEMKLHSPWWGRSAGLLLASLVFVLWLLKKKPSTMPVEVCLSH